MLQVDLGSKARNVMGMRTIRWRNGQCPGRNGQWAERIAHAGSEAVRLVPFCEAEELSSASYSFL